MPRGRPTGSKSLKGIKKRPKMLGPQTDQEKLFCERWLIHFDKDRAWREAGYARHSNYGSDAVHKLEKFAEYLRPIRDAKAKIMAERLAVDSEKIIAGMSVKVFFDPTSFFERTTEPLTEWVKEKGADGKKIEVEQIRTWDGKPIYGERLKPYSDLTAEQQAVVEITGDSGSVIRYRLPTIREQHTYFTSLGRQIGMFTDKLIVERHNHQHNHQHRHLTFDHVPTAKLQSLTRSLLPLVDAEFAQALGFTSADIDEAAQADGVLMPVKTPA